MSPASAGRRRQGLRDGLHRGVQVRELNPGQESRLPLLGSRRRPCCGIARLLAYWRRVDNRAGLVHDDRTDYGQGCSGRQVVVAAEQEVNWKQTRGCGRDQHHDDRPGRTAAASLGKTGRPEPASLTASCLPGGRSPTPREPHRCAPSFVKGGQADGRRPLGPRRASWVLLPGKTATVTITSPSSTNHVRSGRPGCMSWLQLDHQMVTAPAPHPVWGEFHRDPKRAACLSGRGGRGCSART